MLKKCFKFHSIPSNENGDPSATNGIDLELGEKITTTSLLKNYEINNQRQYYDYCFPEDLWRNIVKYLSFLQLANLAEINEFFYSICAPRIETFKAKPSPVLIKIDKENLKINAIVVSIKGLKLKEVGKIIREKLCEQDLLPTAELALEQDPVFFSSKWINFWSGIFQYIAPTRPYLKKLSLKNLHLSKDDFLQFLRFSKSITFISFKNVIFNGKINIGQEIYDESRSLETIEIFMSPSLICDRAAHKYALFYHPGKQLFEYCRSGYQYRSQTMPSLNYQQHLLPYKNFTFDMFWIINTIPLLFVVINYLLLYAVYISINNIWTISFSIFIPLILLIAGSIALIKTIFSQKYQLFLRLACFCEIKICRMSRLAFFLNRLLYMITLLLIFSIYFPAIFKLYSQGQVTVTTLNELSLPCLEVIFCCIFCFTTFCLF